jgi:hypothetical protein
LHQCFLPIRKSNFRQTFQTDFRKAKKHKYTKKNTSRFLFIFDWLVKNLLFFMGSYAFYE